MDQLSDCYSAGRLLQGATPYSKIDVLSAADKALDGIIILPIVGIVNVNKSDGSIDWLNSFEDEDGGNSKRLWFQSLVVVDYLLKAYAVYGNDIYWNKAVEIFEDFLSCLTALSDDDSTFYRDEHAVSNRTLVLLQFYHCLTRIPDPGKYFRLRKKVLQLIEEHANWLSDNENYVSNNHGVMMDRVLLKVCDTVSHMFQNRIGIWVKTAEERLEAMIDRTFDSDGCCKENSAAYHLLNVALFQSLVPLLKDNIKLTKKLNLAEEISYLFIYEDGTVPLVGDSEEKPPVTVPTSIYKGKMGYGVFPEAGFAIIKDEKLHLTARCGGSEFSHRHIDDTSLTLRYRGVQLITDPGMFSYDSSSPRRRHMISCSGHSGFYTEACKKVKFKNFESAVDLGEIKSLEGSSGFNISMKSYLDKNAIISRNVFYAGTDYIVIEDFLESSVSNKWQQQWMIPSDCKVKINNYALSIESSGVSIGLSWYSSRDFEIEIIDALSSRNFMDLDDCKCILIKGCSKDVKLFTMLRLL
ncbi:heparinase II/III family protein [Microbulbifer variabilis]|uniref:heparinase II/III domain-containing protein n=1 Tax=Microbulbifer variabilis TaxID=266805 RepID=UPI001CFCE4DF|nr:heparinase II/III family protein [Microbulbifer variabilis]